jgi:UPF0176 protein
MAPILNVSFYRFTRLEQLEALRDRVKTRALSDGLHGSILLSKEGINGFLAGPEAVLRPYLDWLFTEIPGLAGIRPKESFSEDIPFTRMLVKIKKEIITMGCPDIIPSEKTGRNLPAAELKRWYDSRKDFVIVDTRNDYEIQQGAFEGAVHYNIEKFREFPKQLEKEAARLRDKTVVMYCTGGIRCEKATALAMDLGIKDVYQLEGGILKYFEEVGGEHYKGECFVFDHRAAVDPALTALPERKIREKIAGLKLKMRPNSPESMRVVFALESKGLEFEKIMIADDVEPGSTTPVLFHKDTEYQSAPAILDYLDAEFPEIRLLTPESAERKARMAIWMEWIDGAFLSDTRLWCSEREKMSAEEAHALEVRLEKHLYRLKTPLQKNRNFLVIDDLTQADLAAYSVLEILRSSGFPKDYPERFNLVWEWSDRVQELIDAGSFREPKVLRRPGNAVWPN